MPFNNLSDLKSYNGKHLVRKFPAKAETYRPCLLVVAKAMSYWVGRPLFQQQQQMMMMQHPHS